MRPLWGVALALLALSCVRERAPEETPPGATPRLDRSLERLRMVDEQIASRGVEDPSALEAMRTVPRHLFVPPMFEKAAYSDRPLPIGHGQTISQPYIVGLMTELLDLSPGEKVLEVGTGSGYQAAVLAEITPLVFSIEIIPPLARQARDRLVGRGFPPARLRTGDGYYGWEEEAPFDRIIVTAAADHIPPPLLAQLAPGGRMVIPVGPVHAVQRLVLVWKDQEGGIRTESLLPVRFVPLTGGASP